MTNRNCSIEGQITRHCRTVRIIHWTVTISIFLLIFTGLGQLPLYKRYMLDQVPGFAWTSNYTVTLVIHYLAGIALTFAGVYHLVYHGLRKDFNLLPRRGDFKQSYLIMKAIVTKCEEPPSHKFLAEQRLAYVFLAFSIALTIVTGMVKVIKNYPGIHFSDSLLNWMAHLHNLGMVLVIFGIIAHLGAFVVKENRKLIPSMFTGKCDLEYIKHRHCLWHDELKEKKHL